MRGLLNAIIIESDELHNNALAVKIVLYYYWTVLILHHLDFSVGGLNICRDLFLKTFIIIINIIPRRRVVAFIDSGIVAFSIFALYL